MNQILNDLENLENGGTLKNLYAYGVGIDVHRKFIQVCVLLHQNIQIKQYEREFTTEWSQLCEAREWIIEIIKNKSMPAIIPEPLRYTIESTSTYHLPIIKALGGNPAVVNPLLAGTTRRKTDVLDARLLAYQSMTGLWNESFVVTPDIQTFRLIMKQKQNVQRQATAISNRINNYILRFGHTLGATGSVQNPTNRTIIEDICNDNYKFEEAIQYTPNALYICPEGLPDDVKTLILNLYQELDLCHDKERSYHKQAMEYAKNLQWETSNGSVSGKDLIPKLLSVPFVGENTVLVWLSEIVTPLRFATAKHIAAYCGCDPSLKVSAGKVTSTTRRKGNSTLHTAFLTIAGNCVNRHSEPFGQWGYSLSKRHAKGGWKKARGAVARRIVTAMYMCHMRNQFFTYDGYNFFRIEVPLVDIGDMEISQRVKNILINNQVNNSRQMLDLLLTGNLANLKGIGHKALTELDDWVFNNKNHKTNS